MTPTSLLESVSAALPPVQRRWLQDHYADVYAVVADELEPPWHGQKVVRPSKSTPTVDGWAMVTSKASGLVMMMRAESGAGIVLTADPLALAEKKSWVASTTFKFAHDDLPPANMVADLLSREHKAEPVDRDTVWFQQVAADVMWHSDKVVMHQSIAYCYRQGVLWAVAASLTMSSHDEQRTLGVTASGRLTRCTLERLRDAQDLTAVKLDNAAYWVRDTDGVTWVKTNRSMHIPDFTLGPDGHLWALNGYVVLRGDALPVKSYGAKPWHMLERAGEPKKHAGPKRNSYNVVKLVGHIAEWAAAATSTDLRVPISKESATIARALVKAGALPYTHPSNAEAPIIYRRNGDVVAVVMPVRKSYPYDQYGQPWMSE